MGIISTILLIIFAIIILIGIIRVLFAPYTGFINMLMEMMLLDWLGDLFGVVIELISDTWDD